MDGLKDWDGQVREGKGTDSSQGQVQVGSRGLATQDEQREREISLCQMMVGMYVCMD